MRKLVLATLALGLSLVGSAHAQSSTLLEPPDPDVDAAKSARLSNPKRTELRAAVKGDSRVAPLVIKINEALELKDKRARKAALDALGPQILAVRNDVLKKVPAEAPKIEAALKINPSAIRLLPTIKVIQLPTTQVVTSNSFPATYSYKKSGDGCPDGSDKWDFDGSMVKVRAGSAPGDSDCWDIRAGRSTTIAVPAGMKRMHIQAAAKLDQDAFASAFGWYAKAVAEWGIRVKALNGATLQSTQVAGQTINSPVRLWTLKTVSAKNFFPNPIPFDIGEWADDVQEGDSQSTASLDLPDNIGSQVEVSLWTGGMADADMSGVAWIKNEITVKSVKVTFSK